MRMLTFAKRNAKEILRDPLNLFFGLGFPSVVLILLSAIQANIPVSMFEINHLTPGITVFGLSFMTLFSATLIARDRSSAFLQRLYTSPMKPSDFILGYTLPVLPVSAAQAAVCYLLALILGLKPSVGILYAIVFIIPCSLVFIGLGLLCGVIYVLALMALQYNLPRNGVVLPAVASRVGGLLVPLAMAILFFGEQPRPVQLAGSVLALVSIVALNYDKDHMAAKHVLPLIAIFFADGVATAMAKIFRELGNPAQNDYYLFYIFATAMTMSTVLLLVCRERPGLADLFFGILVGVPNYYAARFLLKALETIPAVVVYPTRGVGGIALVALAGVVLFGERLKRHQWYAMVFVCISVVLLNV